MTGETRDRTRDDKRDKVWTQDDRQRKMTRDTMSEQTQDDRRDKVSVDNMTGQTRSM